MVRKAVIDRMPRATAIRSWLRMSLLTAGDHLRGQPGASAVSVAAASGRGRRRPAASRAKPPTVRCGDRRERGPVVRVDDQPGDLVGLVRDNWSSRKVPSAGRRRAPIARPPVRRRNRPHSRRARRRTRRGSPLPADPPSRRTRSWCRGSAACSPSWQIFFRSDRTRGSPSGWPADPKLRRIGRRNVLLICGFRSLGGCCSVDGGSLGSGEGGRDGCAEEFEGAALDGGGFGQGRDDRAVLAVLHVVAGEGGEVGQQALVGVRG